MIESHVHLDTCLTAGDPVWNMSGTLFEGIECWALRKEKLTKADVRERVNRAVRMYAINGVQHMLLRDFNASIGSYGIGIAILANGNPLGCIFASILFGFLNVMGTTMGRLPGQNIPASIIELIEGIVMICVIISYAVRYAMDVKKKKAMMRKAGV